MLTEISTFGWFKDSAPDPDLLAISTFGWYFIAIDGDGRIGVFRELGDLFDGGMWG